MVLNRAQGLKEKSHEVSARKKKKKKKHPGGDITKNVEGGGFRPLPALLGLRKAFMMLISSYIHFLAIYRRGEKSADNENILNFNLNNSAILFKIVHLECESIFF